MRKEVLSLLVASCFGIHLATAQALPKANKQGAIKVELRKVDTRFKLFRDGQPYFVKGAGGRGYPDRIVAYGGNSIRTWGSQGAEKILDSARRYGLTVLLGLDVARERHGFNYDDTVAVKKQLAHLRAEVMKYKDHPALLGWGIGNELNLQYKNPKVWNAVNDISKMIHSLDKNHFTTTVLAGINKDLGDYIKQRTTDIDLLCINTYADLATLPKTIKEAGWEGAYLVTEWGPTGHWEGLHTAWQSPIEETSSEKAAVYKSRYEHGVESDKDHCLGSYVFLWGQKQERTPTWYGLFTEQGEESEVMDVMEYLWSGKWPKNRAPHLYSLQLDNRKAVDNIYLIPNGTYPILAVVSDADNDPLKYRWEILPEPTKLSEGGDFEERSMPIEGLLANKDGGKNSLTAPSIPGPYRLLVYVTDDHNNVATANIPFYVK